MVMNTIDVEILLFFNGFARKIWSLDYLMVFLSENHLLKGGVLAIILWAFWFQRHSENPFLRQQVISTIVSSFFALFLARALALTLPFRLRPLHDPLLDFKLPYTMSPRMLESWSAFPSDHAVLFMAMAAGIFFISRRVGTAALVYVVFAICLPRIYLGLHYPTDILGGAGLGVVIARLFHIERIRNWLASPALRWLQKSPASFYAFAFFLTYQLADMFDDVRHLGNFLYTLARVMFT